MSRSLPARCFTLCPGRATVLIICFHLSPELRPQTWWQSHLCDASAQHPAKAFTHSTQDLPTPSLELYFPKGWRRKGLSGCSRWFAMNTTPQHPNTNSSSTSAP